MADRPIWRGQLRLALVSCPVALYAAHHERENLHFHFINPDTGHRVRMVTTDAETDEKVERRSLARGYEFKKDHYLILTDEDFASVKVDTSTTLTIAKFVEHGAIDPVYFDSSYYMVPDGQDGLDVYVVLRDAIAKTGRMALTRVVMSQRERAVAIMPMGRGLILHTLYDARDLKDPGELFEQVPAVKPEADMIALATQLIDRQTGAYDPADPEDRYETRLRDLIQAKLRGEGLAEEDEPEPDHSNVIDLMAALKQSLGEFEKSITKSGAKSAPKSGAKPAAAAPAPSRQQGRASPKAAAKSAPAPKPAPASETAPAKRRRAS